MRTRMTKEVLVISVLLAAGAYGAGKEWQEPDSSYVGTAQLEGSGLEAGGNASWQTEAVTVQPEQIFEN